MGKSPQKFLKPGFKKLKTILDITTNLQSAAAHYMCEDAFYAEVF